MSRPEICLYCDGNGNSKATGPCGFCKNGEPLDTQEDWDNSWGKLDVDGIRKRDAECGKVIPKHWQAQLDRRFLIQLLDEIKNDNT